MHGRSAEVQGGGRGGGLTGTSWCHPAAQDCRHLATSPTTPAPGMPNTQHVAYLGPPTSPDPQKPKSTHVSYLGPPSLPGARWPPGRKGDFFLTVGRPDPPTSNSRPSTLTPPTTHRQTPRNEGSSGISTPSAPCALRPRNPVSPLSDLLSDALKDATQKANSCSLLPGAPGEKH
jgi:hypothetical protein